VRWALDHALPLWATAGFDAERGRFEERLTLGGGRLPDVPLRLMSQARQIHAYALAARRGWHADALGLVERAFASMVRDYRGRDGGDGWVFSIARDGRVVDGRRDLYSHAFVLLAIASYVEATGRRDALSLAEETLAFIDRHMTASAGGFVEELPAAGGWRRQNPHMHLFESLQQLWECSRERGHLERVEAIFDLFVARLFRADHGVVGEYFTDALESAEGTAGRLVEPGHHYEWIWLLRRFERSTGRPVQRYVDALYGYADRHGFDRAGMIVGEVLDDGTHQPGVRRIWPVTEAIRSNIAEAKLGRPGAQGKAAALAALLRNRFLTDQPAGGWFDRLDHDGGCAIDFMPASTLYHLIGAIDELSLNDRS
jgi:mannose-6-phosphate isomerase